MPSFEGLRNGGAARVLKVRNFRIYFTGLMVSVSGTWMQTTAQAWLVLQLTNSPLALATVASLQFLPIMLFSLIGGAVADQFPRRKLLFLTQALAAGQAVLLGTLVITDTITIWHIYVLAISLGMINALDAPLRQSFVSELVPLDVLPNAVALNSMAQNLGRILGPALGGVALAAFGVAAAFYVNAATFLGTLIALRLLDTSMLYTAKIKLRRNVFSDIGQSFSYARKRPSVVFLLIGTLFTGMFGQNFTTMVPLVAEYLVKADPAQFGLLNSCLGSGSLLSALILSSRGAPSVRRILIAGSIFGIGLAAVSLSTSLALSCALFAIVGSAYVAYTASVNTSMQMQAPPEMRGRFAAMISLLSAGSSPIGQLLTGAIATGVAVWVAVLFNGAMCCIGMAVAFAYLIRARRIGTVFNMDQQYIEPLEVRPGTAAVDMEGPAKS